MGDVQPTHEQAVRALRALAGLRHADAERHAAAAPEAPLLARSWKLLIRGLLTIERTELRDAEPLLLQAAALAFIDAVGEGDEGSSASRVAAKALHHLGWVYRREERVAEAVRVHRAALLLRERFGSFEELWETTCELGLDADVARSFDEAERSHHQAIDLATRCTQEPVRREAVARTNLATSLAESHRYEHAVAAARSARDAWRRHDVTVATAVEADLNLGSTLLMHGQSLSEREDANARSVVAEATEFLTIAHQGLSAFGSDYAAQAACCRAQLDFANRLAGHAERTAVPDCDPLPFTR